MEASVTVKTIGDALRDVATAPRVMERKGVDHVIVGGVGRRNHADSIADRNRLRKDFRVGRIRLALYDHSWGVRVKKKIPVVKPVFPEPVVEVDHA